MVTWLTSFQITYWDYLLAPILYHFPCDGYVWMFLFTIMELCDTFASYKLYFAFIFSGLLTRNYLFSIFKSNVTLLGRSASSKNSNSSTDFSKNNLKMLGASSFNSLRLSVSSIIKSLKTKLF